MKHLLSSKKVSEDMSTIFITEKPSVAQEYRKVLKVQATEKTDGYIEGFSPVMNTNVIITWAVGHLIEICSPEEHNEAWGGTWKKENLPMIPETFQYKAGQRTASQFKIVKSLYTRKDIDCIYYAGDSGREGIYIQALIRNQIFKKAPAFPEKVVWIDSFTEQAILNGIHTAKPYADYQNMINSGYARAISDWLIGMNLTEAFSISSRVLIKVGRVMTPTLAMVVKRQEEIDNFQKTDYFGVRADDFANWKAVKESKFYDSPLLYNETGFLKKEDAEKLIQELSQDMHLKVEDAKVQNKTEYAPYLFNLADLQAHCSKAFKITPAKTLEYAQSLYEKKYTTYPRTDSRFLSTAVADDLKKQGYSIPKRYVNDAKVTDHYAIIPTLQGDKNQLSGTEKQVYEAIEKRFMDTMKPPFVYDAVSVVYLHQNGERFFESFRIVKEKGFKEKIDDTDISAKPVPQKGSTVQVSTFGITEMETRPPAAYTTGTLIMAMEKAGKLIEDEELREQIKTSGIGTSATRANIIEKLSTPDKKGISFITIDSKSQKVAPTEFGKQVVPVVEKFDRTMASPEMTAEMENKLSAVADGTMSYEDYLADIKKYVADTTDSVLNNTSAASGLEKFRSSGNAECSIKGRCPKCGGEIGKGKFGFYCKNKCGSAISKVFGYELSEKQLQSLLDGKEITYTNKGKKTTVLPEITTHEYQGKTYYIWKVKADVAPETKQKCPCCGGELKSTKFTWECDCGFKFWIETCGHKMKESDLKDLVQNGRTKVYDFTSKAGKKFRASLVLDKDGKKTNFEFENKK